MNRRRKYTPEELKDLEERDELYVCPLCDAHMHINDIGETCPECFISALDLRGDQ